MSVPLEAPAMKPSIVVRIALVLFVLALLGGTAAWSKPGEGITGGKCHFC